MSWKMKMDWTEPLSRPCKKGNPLTLAWELQRCCLSTGLSSILQRKRKRLPMKWKHFSVSPLRHHFKTDWTTPCTCSDGICRLYQQCWKCIVCLKLQETLVKQHKEVVALRQDTYTKILGSSLKNMWVTASIGVFQFSQFMRNKI